MKMSLYSINFAKLLKSVFKVPQVDMSPNNTEIYSVQCTFYPCGLIRFVSAWWILGSSSRLVEELPLESEREAAVYGSVVRGYDVRRLASWRVMCDGKQEGVIEFWKKCPYVKPNFPKTIKGKLHFPIYKIMLLKIAYKKIPFLRAQK